MALDLRKPRPKLADKRKAARAKLDNWIAVRRQVLARDKGKCRAYGTRATDVHHILARSLGGKDEPSNLVAVSRRAHEDIHGHLLLVRWSDDNDRSGTVTFTPWEGAE